MLGVMLRDVVTSSTGDTSFVFFTGSGEVFEPNVPSSAKEGSQNLEAWLQIH